MEENSAGSAGNDKSALGRLPVKQFTVRPIHSTTKNSFCWKYFGNLIVEREGTKRSVIPENVFCAPCLRQSKEENDEELFGKCRIKSYSTKVSTGNLTRHLKEDHQLQDSLQKPSLQGNLNLFFNVKRPNKEPSQSESTKKKWLLARDLALWICKALLPFDFVSNEAMIDFFKKYKIIVSVEDLPSRTTISRQALDDIYETMKSHVKNVMANSCTRYLAVTSDIWTDSYRRLNYITVTVHFISSSMELVSFTLSTRRIDGTKTGEKIKGILQEVLLEYGLEEKKLTLVTDAGSNMKRAAMLLEFENHLCLGHALHNLVVQDGIKKSPIIDELVIKGKKIVKSLRFKLPEMEKEADEEQRRLLLQMEEVGEQIELDEFDPLITDGTDAYDFETSNTGISASRLEDVRGHVPSLKTATPTRWNSSLTLLESLHHECNRVPVYNLLGRLGKTDLRMEEREWKLLSQLIKFLSMFKEATKVLSAASNSTINAALVYRCEIKAILQEAGDEELLPITNLKNNMLLKLNHRMPLNKLIVTAALLDPRFQGLKEIDDFLEGLGETRVSFLSKRIKETVRASDLIKNPTVGSFGAEAECSSGSGLREDTDLFLQLSKKHSNPVCTETEQNEIELECWKYFGGSDPADLRHGDLLKYWRERQYTFPHMSAMARSILCIPATSTPSERVFSIAGLTLNAKRSRLSPNNVNKILFVHDNYAHCSK